MATASWYVGLRGGGGAGAGGGGGGTACFTGFGAGFLAAVRFGAVRFGAVRPVRAVFGAAFGFRVGAFFAVRADLVDRAGRREA